jgi:ankyrin repeat protein
MFMALVQAIAAGDAATAGELLAASPGLAVAHSRQGATRHDARDYYLEAAQHYLYAGDTALHVAAAGNRHDLARSLIRRGADVGARNRRGAEPLHYAADGSPGSVGWDPGAQAATVACLIEAGADPNARDKSGVAPLHRAVRTRCAGAVAALLDGGADPQLTNGRGSTPLTLTARNTGRGGSGSPAAKAEREEIVRLLERAGAARRAVDRPAGR